jgi:hypothetical protein
MVHTGGSFLLCQFYLFTEVLETGHWQGDFGVHDDFALKPFFDANCARATTSSGGDSFLSVPAIDILTSLGESRSSYLEHRWVVEVTSRVPLPKETGHDWTAGAATCASSVAATGA